VSCNASGRADTKEIGNIFYDLNKLMKIKKKSKEKETNNDVPSAFSFFLVSFYNIFVFFLR